MIFDLKNYIKTKYSLNESIQSNIFINKLLNDKSNLFKYYKIYYEGTLYYNYYNLYIALVKKIDEIFNKKYISSSEYTYELSDYKIVRNGFNTDEHFIQFHHQYQEMYNKFKKLENNIFTKPEPLILTACVFKTNDYSDTFSTYKDNNIDLLNITDNHFEIYTFKEMKNKANINNIKNYIQENVVFWCSENDEILGVTRKNKLILLGPTVAFDRSFSTTNFEDIKKTIERYSEHVSDEPITLTLSDNSLLTFLLPDSNIFKLVEKLTINSSSCIAFPYNNKVGAFNSISSNLRKTTGWGNSLNDYVIIYQPESVFISADYTKSSTYNTTSRIPAYDKTLGFNDYKISDINDVIKQHKEDVTELKKSKYKWAKTILNKYKPYGNKEIFSFGKKLETFEYDHLYGDDNYCNKLAYANYLKYKSIIQLNKAFGKIKEVETELNDIIVKIKNYTANNKLISDKIKEVYQKDPEKFKSLIFLYGLYTKTLNNAMLLYLNLIKDIKNLKEYREKNKNKMISGDEYDKTNFIRSIKYQIGNITANLEKIKTTLLDTIDEINEKINNELD